MHSKLYPSLLSIALCCHWPHQDGQRRHGWTAASYRQLCNQAMSVQVGCPRSAPLPITQQPKMISAASCKVSCRPSSIMTGVVRLSCIRLSFTKANLGHHSRRSWVTPHHLQQHRHQLLSEGRVLGRRAHNGRPCRQHSDGSLMRLHST